MKKLLTAVLAATALASGVAAVATPASAQPYEWRHHWRHGYWGPRYVRPPVYYRVAPYRHCWWRYGYRVCRRW